MQQDWTYYIYFSAAAALFALFMRARRRGRSNQVAVVCAIFAVVGLLIAIAAANS